MPTCVGSDPFAMSIDLCYLDKQRIVLSAARILPQEISQWFYWPIEYPNSISFQVNLMKFVTYEATCV